MTRLSGSIVALVVAIVLLTRVSISGPDQAVSAVGGLRLVALALGWYLVAAIACGLLARLTRSVSLVRTFDVVTLPAVRKVLNGALGLSMMTGVIVNSPAAWAAPERPSPPPVMQLVQDAPQPAPPVAATAPAPQAAPEDWLVSPGESFWEFAEQQLATHWSRPPTDAEIVPYWHTLIEANRSRLRTGDPNLIFPGQRFVVPPVA
jgi:hypothetical protein